MPKTRNAFALRSFDEKRILQRPFFQNLNLFVAEDEEILESFDVAQCPNSAAMEEKLSDLRGLMKPVIAYTKRIMDYEFKLEKIMQRYRELYIETSASICKERYERAHTFQQFYVGKVMGALEKLQGKINRTIWAGEKKLDEHRRKEFCLRLKRARIKAGLRQLDIALKVRVSASGYASYEQGRVDPSIPMLIRIAEALKCSPDWLLGFT